MKKTAYKVIARCEEKGRQVKKRVYTNLIDFKRYSPDTIERYKRCYGVVEVYCLIDDKWELIK